MAVWGDEGIQVGNGRPSGVAPSGFQLAALSLGSLMTLLL